MEAWVNSLPPIIGLPIGIVLLAIALAGSGIIWSFVNHFVLSVIVTVFLFVFWRTRRDRIKELY